MDSLFTCLSDKIKNGAAPVNIDLDDIKEKISELKEKAEEMANYSQSLKESNISKKDGKPYTAKDANDLQKNPVQTNKAEQGILWLVCVIPAILLILAMFIISKYELTDDVIDDINRKIEERAAAEE